MTVVAFFDTVENAKNRFHFGFLEFVKLKWLDDFFQETDHQKNSQKNFVQGQSLNPLDFIET